MTSEDERHIKETFLVNEDLQAMLSVWKERSADPLVVCTMMLVQFTSLAGHLFEDEDQYNAFLEASIRRGKHRFAEDKKNTHYVQ
jgi:hypothetical protein